MIRVPTLALALMLALPAHAFAQNAAEDAKTAAAIAALIGPLPQLALKNTDLPLAPELAGRMGMISSIATDPNGAVYLLQRGTGTDPVVVVNRAGKLLHSWGRGLYTVPHAVKVDPNGDVWTTDSVSSAITKFTPAGEKLLEISVGGQPRPGKVSGTTDIAFGPNGRVFIADGYGNARILEYTSDGKKVREWGTPGAGPGQFRVPHSLIIDSDNVMYVADRENGRIERFTLDGKFLGEWTGFGKPMTLAFTADGGILVATGYRNPPGKAPDWVAWVVKIDKATGKPLGYLEVGDDAHGMAALDGGILTGGETAKVAAAHWFRP